MIKNERQYRITRAKLREFSEAIAALDSNAATATYPPELLALHQSALKSQSEDLESDLFEYESLRDGQITVLETESLLELPRSLIKARISRGLTHKDLAERLGLKEQQIQRWESSEYNGVGIETLCELMNAMGVSSREELYLPDKRLTVEEFTKRLDRAGVPKSLLQRILPPGILEAPVEASLTIGEILGNVFKAALAISRIFGAKLSDLLAHGDVAFVQPSFATRFKLPARAKASTVNAYTVFAHYLACVAESAAVSGDSPFVSDWRKFHRSTTSAEKPLTLESALSLCWASGVLVIPLKDPGTFHGAVWRIRERYVIILKQSTKLEARWLYDLLHELGHIALGHVTPDSALIEEKDISPDSTETEETAANQWAENALFDGESEQLEEACVSACGKDIRRLKAVIPVVASEFNVSVGALANYMAFRLQEESQSWWATAHSLQSSSASPFELTRQLLLKHTRLNRLNPFDRDLLIRAITDD